MNKENYALKLVDEIILHCIVLSETQFETWWWPSARAETCCLSNKYSTTFLVVFWLYYLHQLIISNTTGMSQIKINKELVCTESQGINFNPFNNTRCISFKCGFMTSLHFNRSRGSSVGIETRYAFGRSGNRIPVWARLSLPVQTGTGAHPASYTMGTGSFPGVKRPWRGVDHQPLIAPRLKKE